MERELAIKWSKLNAAVYFVWSLMLLIPIIVAFLYRANDQPNNLYFIPLILILTSIIFVIIIYFTMKKNRILRRSKPRNAIITTIYFLLIGLVLVGLGFTFVLQREDKNYTKFIKSSGLIFFPIWFISFFISELAIMAFYAKAKGKPIGSWSAVACAFVAFLLPFSALYISLMFLLHQEVMKIAINYAIFLLLGLFVTFLSVRRSAQQIRKYLEFCNEQNQKPNLYDLIYVNYGVGKGCCSCTTK